jgi:hypothetical protein
MATVNKCVLFHSKNDEARLVQRRASVREPTKPAKRWKQFLSRNPSERAVQAFLERHPVLLPGLWDLHNGPLHDVVVTKLPLGPDYKTDFAFITRHSMSLQFTFVELEAPSKRIFNKDGSFSQEFNQAQQQIVDWVRWAEDHVNDLLDMFARMFATYSVTEDRKSVRAYLLYGRRAEVETSRRHKERWQAVALSSDHRINVMTYDRLRASLLADDTDLIVCTYEKRQFYAKSTVI